MGIAGKRARTTQPINVAGGRKRRQDAAVERIRQAASRLIGSPQQASLITLDVQHRNVRAKFHQGVRLYHDRCWGPILEYALERIAVLRGQVVTERPPEAAA